MATAFSSILCVVILPDATAGEAWRSGPKALATSGDFRALMLWPELRLERRLRHESAGRQKDGEKGGQKGGQKLGQLIDRYA